MKAKTLFTLSLLSLSVAALPAHSDEPDDLLGDLLDTVDSDELLSEGLDDFPVVDTLPEPVAESPARNWHLSGSLQLASQYETTQAEFGSARSGINLALEVNPHPDWQLYAELRGRYEALDEQSSISQLKTNEVYARYALGEQTDLTIGSQFLTWGKADSIRINDLLNPLDLREPGMVDIADTKLPLVMSRLDHYRGDWHLQGVLIHQSGISLLPDSHSDFNPMPGMTVPEEQPAHGWDELSQHQYGLALQYSGHSGDFGLYLADSFDTAGYISMQKTPQGPRPVSRQYERVKHLGSGYTGTLGSWAYKAEMAYRWPEVNNQQLQTMLGFDYNGWSRTSLTFEIGNRYQAEPDDGTEPNETRFAGRIGRNFYNDRLQSNLLLMGHGLDLSGGGLARLNLLWQQTDSLQFDGGLVAYQRSDESTSLFDCDNNRIYAKARYYF